MYTEKIGMAEYSRFENDEAKELIGVRINGHGKIVAHTNCDGEHHPAYVTTEDGRQWTPEELVYDAEIDGRHGVLAFELP